MNDNYKGFIQEFDKRYNELFNKTFITKIKNFKKINQLLNGTN